MKTRIWNVRVKFLNNYENNRRFRSNEILIGSSPKADIKFPRPTPAIAAKIACVETNGKLTVEIKSLEAPIEIHDGNGWKTVTEFSGPALPLIRISGAELHIHEVTEERKLSHFQPEKWAEETKSWERDNLAVWHIRNGLLMESAIFHRDQGPVQLKCGYKVSFDVEHPDHMFLIEFDGIPQKLPVTTGRGDNSFRATFQDNVFVFTKVPEKGKILNIPITRPMPLENDSFKRTIFAVGATWILLMALIQMMPRTNPVEEVAIEKLPDNIAKIILEAEKPHDGGNGQAGGGGYELTQNNDKRGGSGFENKRMSDSSGPEEVVVNQKGALAALTKAEKVFGGGMLKALDAGGALATALGKLDTGVLSGKVKMAGIPSMSGGGTGQGSAKGVMGALNSIGGGGGGSGGLGIGGVGTKGFGGGGGRGGNGSGFGTGVGSGLGKGQGARQLAFDTDSMQVKGGLERSEVEAVIQENISQIRLCYNRGLRTNPGLQGKVATAFTIGGSGQVTLSRVRGSTLAAPIVEDCIKDRIQSWKFPQPRGGGEVAVNYPFLLKSN